MVHYVPGVVVVHFFSFSAYFMQPSRVPNSAAAGLGQLTPGLLHFPTLKNICVAEYYGIASWLGKTVPTIQTAKLVILLTDRQTDRL